MNDPNNASNPASRAAGFTMFELMVSIVLLTIVATTAGTLQENTVRNQVYQSRYERDLSELRVALHTIEDDLRHATEVTATDGGFVVAFAGRQQFEFRITDNRVLVRRESNGRERKLARCIDKLQIRDDGTAATVGLTLHTRTQKSPPTIWTTVALRNGVSR